MRIIGGKYGGRRIPATGNLRARPTTDFAKENLFNILSNHFCFEECKVLDLFAGTGSISFEFASRGAKEIDLVDVDRHHLRFINTVIEQLKIDSINPVNDKAEIFLKKVTKSYDIVFADPPYDAEVVIDLPDLIFENQVLNENGWFILEHSNKHQFKDHEYFKEVRRYGSVHFTIFKNENSG